jgi:hypothetical protein
VRKLQSWGKKGITTDGALVAGRRSSPWRTVAVQVPLLAALLVAGCGEASSTDAVGGQVGNGGNVTQPGPSHGPLDDVRGRSWVDALISQAEQTGNANIASMDATEYHDLVARVPDLVCCIRQVVSYLLDIDPDWTVDQPTVEKYLHSWCSGDPEYAVDLILSSVPGAGLEALPALNQLIWLGIATCADVDAGTAEWTSNQFVTFTYQNSRAIGSVGASPVDPQQISRMGYVYKAMCAATQKGLGRLVARALKLGRGSIWVSLALEAAMSGCPDALAEMVQ